MTLSAIATGMSAAVVMIPEGRLKNRLRQFGLTEGMEIYCRMAKKKIVALQWAGTVVALRRADLRDIRIEVMACTP